jgi:hypothetical protein
MAYVQVGFMLTICLLAVKTLALYGITTMQTALLQ